MRYKFGVPYSLKNHILFGTDQFPPVSVLLRGLIKVCENLPSKKQGEILKRLDDRGKHLDHLSEFDPINRLKDPFSLEYEPDGMGKDRKKIDWFIRFSDKSSCLIDVKNRIKKLLELAGNVLNKKTDMESSNRSGTTEGLLKNCEVKFSEKKDALQGIWIRTDIYYDEESIIKDFNGIKEAIIQFLVLTHFDGEARIFSRCPEQKLWLKEKFGLVEMEKKIF